MIEFVIQLVICFEKKCREFVLFSISINGKLIQSRVYKQSKKHVGKRQGTSCCSLTFIRPVIAIEKSMKFPITETVVITIMMILRHLTTLTPSGHILSPAAAAAAAAAALHNNNPL